MAKLAACAISNKVFLQRLPGQMSCLVMSAEKAGKFLTTTLPVRTRHLLMRPLSAMGMFRAMGRKLIPGGMLVCLLLFLVI